MSCINRKMKAVVVNKPSISINEYKETITTYVFYKKIDIAISSVKNGGYDFNRYTEEGMDLFRETFVALTKDKSIEENMQIIDSKGIKYKVTFVQNSDRFSQLFLKVVK